MSEEVLLLKEGKWGNETPGLAWAGREQQLLREKKERRNRVADESSATNRTRKGNDK